MSFLSVDEGFCPAVWYPKFGDLEVTLFLLLGRVAGKIRDSQWDPCFFLVNLKS